jgi:hypothetical protein
MQPDVQYRRIADSRGAGRAGDFGGASGTGAQNLTFLELDGGRCRFWRLAEAPTPVPVLGPILGPILGRAAPSPGLVDG